jgi:DNA repair exonuclease SbcCD ATPase subunit
MLDENFNETIKSRYRDTFKYDNFSAGEKQRIDTAILLAWREIARSKNTTNCNILMIDEGLDTHLDNDGIEVVLDILSESSNSNIFIISHKGEEYFERFERILEVEKSGNFSQVVEKYS